MMGEAKAGILSSAATGTVSAASATPPFQACNNPAASGSDDGNSEKLPADCSSIGTPRLRNAHKDYKSNKEGEEQPDLRSDLGPVTLRTSSSMSSADDGVNVVLEEEATTVSTTRDSRDGEYEVDDEYDSIAHNDSYSNDDEAEVCTPHNIQFSTANASSPPVDDPYTYSDDSASLSDAYFHPQSDDEYVMGHRYHYHHYLYDNAALNHQDGLEEEKTLDQGHDLRPHLSGTYPLANYYGSLNRGDLISHAHGHPPQFPHHHHNSHYYHQSMQDNTNNRTSSPLWMSGPIQEDSEVDDHMFSPVTNASSADICSYEQDDDERCEVSPLLLTTTSAGSSGAPSSPHNNSRENRTRRNKRRNKHFKRRATGGRPTAAATAAAVKMQQERRLERLQARHDREAAVTKVRGKPQKITAWQDFLYAVLFLTQLSVVLLCALRYGLGVIVFREDITTWGWKHNLTRHFYWDHASDGNRRRLLSTNVTGLAPGASSPGTSTELLRRNDVNQTIPRPNSDSAIAIAATTTSKPVSALNSSEFFAMDPTTPKEAAIIRKHSMEYRRPLSTKGSLLLPGQNQDNLGGSLSTYASPQWFTIDYQNVICLVAIAGFYACMISYLSFGCMLILARALIPAILVFSVVLTVAWGVIGLWLKPYGVISVIGFAALLLTLVYALYNWRRVPFSATNLYTALTAMRCTADIVFLGLFSLTLSFGWCLVWAVAFIGIINSINSADCDRNGDEDCEAHVLVSPENSLHHQRLLTALYLFFIFSFYWTAMVIKNVTRVTIASAIGTWWFSPGEIRPFCSSAVSRPFIRSLTVSLGSICLGSLVVLPAQALSVLGQLICYCCCWSCCLSDPCSAVTAAANPESLNTACMDVATSPITSHLQRRHADMQNTESFKQSNEGGAPNQNRSTRKNGVGDIESSSTLGGTAEWDDAADDHVSAENPSSYRSDSTTRTTLYNQAVSWMDRFCFTLRCCNRWSYTYIGMYGYSFGEAGERAILLFETREWMAVVRDNLIQNVLFMASVVIGASTGTFALVVEETDGFEFTSFHKPVATAFIIGSILGFCLSNVLLLGVVGSAVNTILVCFAAGPFEFDKNHPRLSREMREVWSQQVWEPPE